MSYQYIVRSIRTKRWGLLADFISQLGLTAWLGFRLACDLLEELQCNVNGIVLP